jgi:hypothetical protein
MPAFFYAPGKTILAVLNLKASYPDNLWAFVAIVADAAKFGIYEIPNNDGRYDDLIQTTSNAQLHDYYFNYAMALFFQTAHWFVICEAVHNVLYNILFPATRNQLWRQLCSIM